MDPRALLGAVPRREVAVGAVLAFCLLATAAVVPTSVESRPAFEIPVREQADTGSLASADGEDWTAVPSVTVPLASAGAAVPQADQTSVERLQVRAARTDQRLYLRVSWIDPTRDASTDRVRAFADAVAVQLPANASTRPPIAMGGPDNLVNVWYWSASNQTQALLAGGPGTTTLLRDSQLRTDAVHADGRWTVVFSRPLAASGPNRTDVATDADLDVAMAVWNGSNMERSGRKATSEWYYLALGPGPRGPPYEAILWTVAGLAIVFTTLVTIEGVRRTRGE